MTFLFLVHQCTNVCYLYTCRGKLSSSLCTVFKHQMSNHITNLDRLQFINTTQHFIDMESDSIHSKMMGSFVYVEPVFFWRSEFLISVSDWYCWSQYLLFGNKMIKFEDFDLLKPLLVLKCWDVMLFQISCWLLKPSASVVDGQKV